MARVSKSARRMFAGLTLLLVAIVVVLLITAHKPAAPPKRQRQAVSTAQGAPPACSQTEVLSKWPLTQLANQTIVFPAEETDVAAAVNAAKAGYGGMILYGDTAPANLAQSLAQLQADVPNHLGWLVMTDEEGGGIQRMANLVGSIPWASQMGATMTVTQIQVTAEQLGSKMLQNGITMDLAPVLDVDGQAVEPGAQDPDGFRSFGGQTSIVVADGTAFMKGLLQSGVIPVVKHFPGLGGASANTDDGPANTLPWSTLKTAAIPPFVTAIQAGAPAIMISNAMVPGLTGTTPASLSVVAVTQELRDTLGFKGLIMTDSLSADAISNPPLSLTVPEAAVEAIEAGNDMVLFNSTGSTDDDLALAASTSSAIIAAVNAGHISQSQLIAAAAKVLAAKKVNLCE